MNTELAPCPFCGSHNVAQGATTDRISVWCFCGARGPDVPFSEYCDPAPPIDECRALWNRRVSPSQGEGPVADVVERTSNPGERREIQFHLDRLNAWLTELWAANNLTLHMCNGTVRTGLHGLLCDIRDDVMAVRDALASLAPRDRERETWGQWERRQQEAEKQK